jgi:pimeloyl-ACP methyl ester carboxylesterase
MKRSTTRRAAWAMLALLLSGGASVALAQGGSPSKEDNSRPLVIAKQGYLFVGGRYHTFEGAQYISGQAYVEYQIPKNLKHPYPIVMIEGFGLTGTNFTGTPDGREGWAQYFLRQGYAVYVYDQPGRGRSPWITDKYGVPPQPFSATAAQNAWGIPEQLKLYPNAHLHNQWPGEGVIGDPIFDQFAASTTPAIGGGLIYEQLNQRAGAELLDSIGPAILLGHSQGGLILWPIANARPNKVKALVAVEPGGPPFYGVRYVGAPNWFEYNTTLSFPYGITTGPLTYSPAITDPAELQPVQEETAQGPNLVRCWRQAEPAHQLVKLMGIPTAIVTAEASSPAARDHCTSQFLTQAGVENTHIRLEEVGIHGNSHMMMLEENNLEIAKVIAKWLKENVREGRGR